MRLSMSHIATSKHICLAILCCLRRAFVQAQGLGAEEYVTGMTVVGTPSVFR
jgi:hypothetical protein